MSKKEEVETTRRQEELLKWLFEFQALDVKNIGIREAQRQLKELVVVQCFFAQKVLVADWIELHRDGRTTEAIESRNNESIFRKQVQRLTKPEVVAIHEWLRSVFEAVRPPHVRKEDLELPYIPYWREKGRVRIPRKQRYVSEDFKRVSAVPLKSRELHQEVLEQFLEENGPRIARCQVVTCDKLFVRHRRQRYCSLTCQQAVQSAAWYQRNKDAISERKRQRYKDSVRKKTYPKLKVGSRKSN